MNPFDSTRNHVVVRWLFLRVLGLVFLAAFGSLWVQADGLFGSKGIAPVAELVEAARSHLGAEGWKQLPTVLWWDATDVGLDRLFQCGMGLSVLLILGIAPVPVLVMLLVLYHSLLLVGDPFLNFQWDILLLEAGFLAIFFAPLNLIPRPSRESGPPVLVVFLMRFLLFKLMFASGAVKLTSRDPHWADLTAMDYHYMTQPLPPWTAWYWHQLPAFVHKLETLATFVLELAVPFLVFGHVHARAVAFAGFSGLLVMILVTGNYGFFNWLTLALALTVLDDNLLPSRLRRWIAGPEPEVAPRGSRWHPLVIVPVAAVCFLVSAMHLLRSIELGPERWPGIVRVVAGPAWNAVVAVDTKLAPLHVFSEYGLFRVMTTERPEVVIEGSRDGSDWKPYEFRYKMGDPNRRPGFVAPHMPRLDWQLWFAALQRSGRQRWFRSLLIRLLQGSPPVLALLETNPFPDAPPRYIRATLYDYTFTTYAERRATGAWWRRTELGPFFQSASLE